MVGGGWVRVGAEGWVERENEREELDCWKLDCCDFVAKLRMGVGCRVDG